MSLSLTSSRKSWACMVERIIRALIAKEIIVYMVSVDWPSAKGAILIEYDREINEWWPKMYQLLLQRHLRWSKHSQTRWGHCTWSNMSGDVTRCMRGMLKRGQCPANVLLDTLKGKKHDGRRIQQRWRAPTTDIMLQMTVTARALTAQRWSLRDEMKLETAVVDHV